VTLLEARRQIEERGCVKASNAEEATAKLYEMGHALPTEPTRQEWECLPVKANRPLGHCQSGTEPKATQHIRYPTTTL
jgi:hypothetical protein